MTTWSCSETAAFDLHLQQDCGIPASLLMENAGSALARSSRSLAQERGCAGILVVAGPGNNGGDGLVAARQLAQDYPVEVVAPLGLPRPDPAQAAGLALQGARGLSVPCQEGPLPAPLRDDLLVVDALFGTGLARPLSGRAAAAVAAINASGCPVLAVDLPSGLDGDSGRILGSAVKAGWTLSFVAPKHGFRRGDGPAHCGRIQTAGIGVSAAYAADWLRQAREGARR